MVLPQLKLTMALSQDIPEGYQIDVKYIRRVIAASCLVHAPHAS